MEKHDPSMKNKLYVILSGLLLASFAALRAAEPAKPNVVLILIDDFGYEGVTADGGESYKTPVMDKLAATGRQAVVQCVLKADQFADEGVELTVRTSPFSPNHLIEFEFRPIVTGNCVWHQACPTQARAGDSHQARGHGVSPGTHVLQAVTNPVRAG